MAVSKIQTGLRLEEDVWGKISYIAKKNKRSLNSQIEFIVQKCIEEYENQNGSIALTDNQAD